jgi:hypothetical protein
MLIAASALLALAGPVDAQPVPACTGEAYELARRFTGTWQEFTVTAGGERLEGRLDSSLDAGGCAITQTFTGVDGSFSFRSLGYVEASTGQWVETYVLSNGRVAGYRWRVEGEDIVIDRVSGGKPDTRRRLRVSFESADAYRVVEEMAPSGSDEWFRGAVTLTRRFAAAH